MSFTQPRFFQKKWFLALFIALIIVLIVESSLLVFLVLVSGLGRQAFPSIDLSYHFRPSCTTLVPTMIAQTANNRTYEYSCPGQGALYMPESCGFFCFPSNCCGADGILVKPTFTLPPGYLRLSLLNINLGNCTSRFALTLDNDQNLTVGGAILNGNRLYYDYCAVVTGSSGPVQGFTITWEEVPWPGLCCTLTASPSTITVPEAVNASSTTTITLTAINKFFGNVSITGTGEDQGYTGLGTGKNVNTEWTWRFNPTFVILKPGASNSTTVTIILVKNPVPQTFILAVYTYPSRTYYTGVTGSITVKVP